MDNCPKISGTLRPFGVRYHRRASQNCASNAFFGKIRCRFSRASAEPSVKNNFEKVEL